MCYNRYLDNPLISILVKTAMTMLILNVFVLGCVLPYIAVALVSYVVEVRESVFDAAATISIFMPVLASISAMIYIFNKD